MSSPKLAQCHKCQAYTLLDAGVITVAVDVAPLDRAGYISAVMGGIGLYRVEKAPRGATRLRSAPLGSPAPSWAPSGAQIAAEGLVHAEHPCPATSSKAVSVEAAKPPPVCDQWRATGWTPARPCPRSLGNTKIQSCHQCEPPPFDLAGSGLGALESLPRVPGHPRAPRGAPDSPCESEKRQVWPSPTASAASPGPETGGHTAPAATKPSQLTASATVTGSAPSGPIAGAQTPPPSASSSATASGVGRRPTHLASRPPRCGTCRKLITPGTEFWGIQHGHQWIMAEHESCE